MKIQSSSVSKIETGENSPSDQTISLICKKFNINEE
ncbi:MAG: helix-turn-helix transcriptional regulator [Coprococcus sp.]|nr:helix-turn-helix transcriptional regulator [Coprococcus sp.]